MTLIQSLILGLVQGITEFLPISSSGHLILFQKLFGFENLESFILFDLVLHLGTLAAILTLLYPKIIEAFQGNQLTAKQLLLSTLPLFPLVVLMKPIRALFNTPEYLGFFFLITAAFLWTGLQFSRKAPKLSTPYKDALTIGLFQAGALFPGVSRSGSTITAARLIGWDYSKAFTYSFLLAIPTILGGVVLEVAHLVSLGEALPSLGLTEYFLGFFTAFFSGIFSLRLLMKWESRNKWMIFVWYCLILGIITLYLFN